VARLLTAHAPDWAPYRGLTGKALAERLLVDYGMRIPRSKNKQLLDPAAVRDELARRSLDGG
jgi:S-DNA-T family DNA segregation ATPase FtsK/SpoIIIE